MAKGRNREGVHSHGADRPREPHHGRRGVSPRYKALIEAHDWKGRVAVDIGCGSGAGTLLLAGLGASATGIDIDPEVIALGASRAKEDGLTTAKFRCADVESSDWKKIAKAPDGLDGVVAHLCFSEAIARRAARSLKAGGVLIVRSFEKHMWKEAGDRSPFALSRGEMRELLGALGFTVSHLEVERRTQRFPSFAAFEAEFLDQPARRARWEEDGRLEALRRSFARGNRALTESFLVLEARRNPLSPKGRRRRPKPGTRPRPPPS
jgi:SAM-dependent methyltransferase